MKDRRTLAEGLSQQEREQAFVYDKQTDVPEQPSENESARNAVTTPPAGTAPPSQSAILPQYAGRVPVTARMRPEVASAVKRASLTRQLDGIHPHTVQDIVEEAVEAWLRTNHYLS